MANIILTVISIIAGIWILCWLITLLIQYLLKRTVGVNLKIGKLGVLGFSKLQLSVRSGLTVKIERVWLSSSFFNPDVRKPLVLCFQDIRIQANVGHEIEQALVESNGSGDQAGRGGEATPTRGRSKDGRSVKNSLAKMLFFGQFFGIRIQNLTVMLLKTMMPDSLVHMTASEISLDITIVNESYVIKSSLTSLLCKALRSIPGDTAMQNCLAELSVSLQVEAKSDTIQPLQFKTVVAQVLKPQMMLTEGFLQNLPKPKSADDARMVNITEPDDEDLFESEQASTFPAHLQAVMHLQALSFKIVELDVKIVRETKQRSLSVSLKHFFTCLNSSLNNQRTLSFNFSLVLEEFLTKSPQAQFAELSKISIRAESVRDHVEMGIKVCNGFFHYHHEEVQYWSTVLLRVSQRNATSVNRQTPRRKGARKSLLLSWLRGRKTNIVLDMTQLSSAVSSVACQGLHFQLSQARLTSSFKAAVGVEDMSSVISALDVSMEIEIQNVLCCHLEAKLPEGQINGHVHHWDHVIYLTLLIVKIQKVGREVRFEAMEDSLQIEWSTKTFEVLSQLLGAFSRPRTFTHPLVLNPTYGGAPLGSDEPGVYAERLLWDREETVTEQGDGNGPFLHMTVKLDVTNISVFICDSAGGTR